MECSFLEMTGEEGPDMSCEDVEGTCVCSFSDVESERAEEMYTIEGNTFVTPGDEDGPTTLGFCVTDDTLVVIPREDEEDEEAMLMSITFARE